MTTKKKTKSEAKGTTYEELRRKLDKHHAYLSPEDGDALLETVQEMRGAERRRVRGKHRRRSGAPPRK